MMDRIDVFPASQLPMRRTWKSHSITSATFPLLQSCILMNYSYRYRVEEMIMIIVSLSYVFSCAFFETVN